MSLPIDPISSFTKILYTCT